jgi:parallel beta-helix repeat protein
MKETKKISLLLLTGMLTLAVSIQPVRAYIYIESDGSIDPPTAPIERDGDTYTFTGNITYPAYDGIVIYRDNIVVDGNGYTLSGSGTPGYGLQLYADKITIQNANIENFQFCLYLWDSSFSTIRDCNITATQTGLDLGSSSSNTISGNTITTITENSDYGIFLRNASNNNTISANTITAYDEHGINLWDSSDNTIFRNAITDNGLYGIRVEGSSNNNTILANTITNNGGGIILEGTNHTVSANNITYNGGNGIYISSLSNRHTISGNTITNNSNDGIIAWSSSLNVISGNNIRNHDLEGVDLNSSSDNTVSANTITGNLWDGISLYDSNSNIISGNAIANNTLRGIVAVTDCSDNTIYQNNITQSGTYGINLHQGSSNNTIYHNNFVDNTQQASASSDSTSVWNDSYPSGGNYWNDHLCADSYTGAKQDISGSDSICDDSYIIGANDRDEYPLMEPWSVREVPDEEGGLVENDAGTAKVVIEPNALSEPTAISITQDPFTSAGIMIRTGTKAVTNAFIFTPEDINFNEPVTITLTYEPSQVGDANNLGIYRYNESLEEWVADANAICDPNLNECYLDVTHFSEYVIGADAQDSDGDGIPDDVDNCSDAINPEQNDGDDDGVGDFCDNCPNDYNPDQTDICPCRRAIAADLDDNCYVDFADFAAFASQWLECSHRDDPECE